MVSPPLIFDIHHEVLILERCLIVRHQSRLIVGNTSGKLEMPDLVCIGCKAAGSVKDELIPVICGCVGAVLGIAGLYLMPDFPAKDVINALAVGIVSGLAATGVNQIYKQLTKTNQ